MPKYFVSYNWSSDKQHGSGNRSIEAIKRPTSLPVLNEWKHLLEENLKDTYGPNVKVIILFYKRLAWWSL